MLTKSDFLLYLEAPLHLWAKNHDKLTKTTLSAYDLHLMNQGYEVESIAKKFVKTVVLKKYTKAELLWQPTYVSGDFQSRADAVIHDLDTDTYDLYEIKSSTSTDKVHIYDATFQAIVMGESLSLGTVNLILLNDKYVRGEELDIEKLFSVTNLTEDVAEMTPEIEVKMHNAVRDMNSDGYIDILNCLKPAICPCPELCHPNLPIASIYNIPKLKEFKARDLQAMRKIAINDIPDGYPLSDKQQRIVDVIASNVPYIDKSSIAGLLGSLSYPLYFIDYETYASAIPMYQGYKPYQQMVFQYSLHIIEADGKISKHDEYLAQDLGDPAKKLIEHMRASIGDIGSVIVWNKTFESSRNKEMGELYPEHKEFMTDLNKRMVDLADSVNKGYCIHPKFLGSWSIKMVLPVMAPELSYKALSINKGDQAMTSWFEMISSDGNTKKETATALLKYCEMDTMAMVRIWQELGKIISQDLI